MYPYKYQRRGEAYEKNHKENVYLFGGHRIDRHRSGQYVPQSFDPNGGGHFTQ